MLCLCSGVVVLLADKVINMYKFVVWWLKYENERKKTIIEREKKNWKRKKKWTNVEINAEFHGILCSIKVETNRLNINRGCIHD